MEIRAHGERKEGREDRGEGLRWNQAGGGWKGKGFGNWARVRKKQEGNRKLSLEPRSQEGEARSGWRLGWMSLHIRGSGQ